MTVNTVFPGDVDPRVCFSDISLKHANVLEEYNALIKQGRYQDASALLYANKDIVDYFGADIFNLLENRIVAIEDYAVAITEIVDRGTYSPNEPPDAPLHHVWIG